MPNNNELFKSAPNYQPILYCTLLPTFKIERLQQILNFLTRAVVNARSLYHLTTSLVQALWTNRIQSRSYTVIITIQLHNLFSVQPTFPLLVVALARIRKFSHYIATYLGNQYLKTLLVNKGTNVTTFWVMWRHRSRDHKTRSGWFPICGPLTPTLYLTGFQRYWASNILGSRPWPFGVTWRHRSCDHKIRSGWFPIGGPLTPTLFLASLLRYYASSVRWAYSHCNSIVYNFGRTWGYAIFGKAPLVAAEGRRVRYPPQLVNGR